MAGEARAAVADARAGGGGRVGAVGQAGRVRASGEVGVAAVVAAGAKTGVVLGVEVGRPRGAAYRDRVGEAAVGNEVAAPAGRACEAAGPAKASVGRGDTAALGVRASVKPVPGYPFAEGEGGVVSDKAVAILGRAGGEAGEPVATA